MTASRYGATLRDKTRTWLVTGSAGFIGSHVVEALLQNNQIVIGVDNLRTGRLQNLHEVRELVGDSRWKNFDFHEADICDIALCRKLAGRSDYVIHLAALASVSNSIEYPEITHHINVTGFLNLLIACKESPCFKRMSYASTSAAYGDNKNLPLKEFEHPKPLSPYAASKLCNEVYAESFLHSYGVESVGLRYFNVYGERQDPNGPYAAVIPTWIGMLLNNEKVFINGDGQQSRDFIYVKDVVDANIASCLAPFQALEKVYNVGSGKSINLLDLFNYLKDKLSQRGVNVQQTPIHRDARLGDIKHSCADIESLHDLMHSDNEMDFSKGLDRLIDWYMKGFHVLAREKESSHPMF